MVPGAGGSARSGRGGPTARSSSWTVVIGVTCHGSGEDEVEAAAAGAALARQREDEARVELRVAVVAGVAGEEELGGEHRSARPLHADMDVHAAEGVGRRDDRRESPAAALVGVLVAALYDPVWTSAIHSSADFGLALAAFGLLVYGRVSPVLVVALAAIAGWLLAL